MNLIEADAKALLRNHGLPVPAGRLLAPTETCPESWTSGAAVKAQLFAGGRGKAGLVRLSTAAELPATVQAVREALQGMQLEPHVLLEEKLQISAEYYLALRIDDVAQCPTVVFSMQGGVEVEAHGQGASHILPFPAMQPLRADQLAAFFIDAGAPPALLGSLCRFTANLYRVFCAEDAELIEINPLAVTHKNGLVALDAKIVLDDDAHFRHLERENTLSWKLRRVGQTSLEQRAAGSGITFVTLDGDIALLTGGAGNGMMVFDALADAGYRPANFVDTIGGSGPDQWCRLGELVFEYAEQAHVRAIVAYFTLSVTPLKSLVDGLLQLLAKGPPPKPLIIGILASGAAASPLSREEAQRVLGAAGLECMYELPEMIERLESILTNPSA